MIGLRCKSAAVVLGVLFCFARLLLPQSRGGGGSAEALPHNASAGGLAEQVGQERTTEQVVELDQLIAEALENNPDIAAARRRFEAAAKRPSQAGSLPDPSFSLSNFGVGHPFSRLSGSEFANYAVGVSQEIPFPGKLSLRRGIAQKEADSERQTFRAEVLRVVAGLKRAYFEIYLGQKTIEIMEKNRELLERVSKITEARYRVGSGIQQDLIKAQLEVTLLAQRLEVVARQRASQEALLRSLLNRSSDGGNSSIRTTELKRSELAYTLEQLSRLALDNAPQLRSRRELVESRGFALDLARKGYLPDFSASLQYQKTGPAFPDYYMAAVEVKVPLYFWRKQRLGVEESAVSLEQSRAEYRSAAQELLFNIKDQYLTAKTSERLLKLYEDAVVPQASSGVDSALAAYETGKVDFLTVMNSLALLLNYETDYYRQLTEYHKAVAKLEELSGAPIP